MNVRQWYDFFFHKLSAMYLGFNKGIAVLLHFNLGTVLACEQFMKGDI
jgi:hypothetical protein